MAKFAGGVVDTGDKFAAGVVDNLPVVHLELQISPLIFEKFWNDPNGILWDREETDTWKKPEAKISRHCPFDTVSF